MIVALDYDNTFTVDPAMWASVVDSVRNAGHEVICITGREDTPGNLREISQAMPEGMAIVLCGKNAKQNAAIEQGYEVDVWIDDNPSRIANSNEPALKKKQARRLAA